MHTLFERDPDVQHILLSMQQANEATEKEQANTSEASKEDGTETMEMSEDEAESSEDLEAVEMPRKKARLTEDKEAAETNVTTEKERISISDVSQPRKDTTKTSQKNKRSRHDVAMEVESTVTDTVAQPFVKQEGKSQ